MRMSDRIPKVRGHIEVFEHLSDFEGRMTDGEKSRLEDDGKIRMVRELDNTVVRGGRAFIASLIAGSLSEYTPNTYVNYMNLGLDNSTNSGVAGPRYGDLPTSGPWQGVADADWKPTEEITTGGTPSCHLEVDSVSVLDDRVVIWCTFPNSSFPYSEHGGTVNIREICIHISNTVASADPYDIVGQKPNTMVSRAVLFKTEGGYYKDNPIEKVDGGSISFRYEYRLG